MKHDVGYRPHRSRLAWMPLVALVLWACDGSGEGVAGTMAPELEPQDEAVGVLLADPWINTLISNVQDEGLRTRLLDPGDRKHFRALLDYELLGSGYDAGDVLVLAAVNLSLQAVDEAIDSNKEAQP